MAFISEIKEKHLIQDKCGAYFVIVNGWLCYGSTSTSRVQIWPMSEKSELIQFLKEAKVEEKDEIPDGSPIRTDLSK